MRTPLTLVVAFLTASAPNVSAQARDALGASGSQRPEKPESLKNASQKLPAALPPVAQALALAKTHATECDPDSETCPGMFAFSYSGSLKDAPKDGGAQGQSAGLSFNVYLTRKVFVQLDNRNVVSRKAGSERHTGFGDVALNAGADVLVEEGSRPGLGLIYGLKVPTASESKGLGSGHVDHSFLAALSKTFGKTYFELDVSHYLSGDGDGKFEGTPSASGLFIRPLGGGGKCKLYVELGGDFAANGARGSLYNFDYLQFKLSDTTALRIGGTLGLTPNSPRSGLYVAIKVNGRVGAFAH